MVGGDEDLLVGLAEVAVDAEYFSRRDVDRVGLSRHDVLVLCVLP